MKLIPLFDRVVLNPEKSAIEKKGEIYIPKDKDKQHNIAIVVAVGHGEIINGQIIPMLVKVGDKVVYNKYASFEFESENGTLLMTKQTDLIAIICEN